MENIRKLWENDLKNKKDIENKLNSFKNDLKNYKKIVAQNGWEKLPEAKKMIKKAKNNIAIFEKWLLEF